MKTYLNDKGQPVKVAAGLGGDLYGVFSVKPGGSLKRVVSPALPMVADRAQTQRNLDGYATKKGWPAQSAQIRVGADMRYVGDTHSFLRGQTVQVKAVHLGHRAAPDEAEIVDKAGAVVAAGEMDMIEVAPYVDGRSSWVTSDAGIDDLEDI